MIDLRQPTTASFENLTKLLRLEYLSAIYMAFLWDGQPYNLVDTKFLYKPATYIYPED